MNQRYIFYWILWSLGELSGFGQWMLFRHAVPVPEYWLLGLFILLPFVYVIPNTMASYLPLDLTRLLARLGGYWFIMAYYATLLLIPAFLLWLIAEGFGATYIWQSLISVYYSRAALILLAVVLVAGIWRGSHPVVRTVTVATDKPIERNFTVAFASDIHLGAVLGTVFARKFTADVMALHPDLILLGGDIIDGNLEYVLKENSFSGFSGLRAPLGVYGVFGNHDTYSLDLELERKELERNGVQCLRGETVSLMDGVTLTGMEDYMLAPKATFPKVSDDVFSVVMEHEPLRIPQAVRSGADLYFAGHTHAGQFWPNRWVTKRIFLLDYGTRCFERLTAVVSSGYGAWGQLFRLGAAAEIVLVTVTRNRYE